jgi:aldehyde dehydrogenase (NAD+)
MEKIVQEIRETFNTQKTKTEKWRRDQLNAIDLMLSENVDALCEAIKVDLNKPKLEAVLGEIAVVRNGVYHALKHLSHYLVPQKVVPIVQLRAIASTFVQFQPKGVVLNIAAWNYPFMECFLPLAGIVASGNCAIIKPSELAPKCAELITRLVAKYLDNTAIRVVNGGVEETTELLKVKFDHIIYTGSTMIGKIVMAAAAKHMTPVTLEWY